MSRMSCDGLNLPVSCCSVSCQASAVRRAFPLNGTSVWTGRALQAESDDLEVIGVALLYPALERNVCVPGHHGYPRASDLIRAQHCAVAGPGQLRARGGSGRLL